MGKQIKKCALLTIEIALLCVLTNRAVAEVTDHKWNLVDQWQQITSNNSTPWSIGLCDVKDWNCQPAKFLKVSYRPDAKIFIEADNKDNWIAWRHGDSNEINLMPRESADSLICWKAPESGRFSIKGHFRRSDEDDSGKNDGIRCFIQSSAMPGKQRVLWSQRLRGTKQDFNLDDVVLAKGQSLIFRINKADDLMYDNRSFLAADIILKEKLTNADALASSNDIKRPIIMGDESFRLVFSGEGRFIELRDLTTDTLIAESKEKNPAWVISIDGNDKTISSDNYPAPKVVCDGEKVVFTWQKTSMPTVKAVAEYQPDAGQFRFDLTVNNRSKNVLGNIGFPNGLYLKKSSDSYMVCSANNNYESTLAFLDKMTNTSLMYPGYLQMQMIGFKIGKSSLLVYTDDTQGFVKWYNFKNVDDRVKFDNSSFIYLKPGDFFTVPYSLIYKIIPGGTYLEMAREYGEWGRKQWWAQEKFEDKVKRTPMLKYYAQYGFARVHSRGQFEQKTPKGPWTLANDVSDLYKKEILDQADLYEQAYKVHPGYWYPEWHGYKFDSPYPDYFPVGKQMGDFQTFHDELIRTQRPMMYHVNMAHWVKISKSYREDHMACWNGRTYNQTWSDLEHVCTSPSLTLPREMQTINRIKDQAGINGVYLDVIGHAFATDNNPRSKYGNLPNGYQLAKQNTFREIRKAITGPIMTESRNEIILPFIDIGYGISGTPGSDHVPMWELVYGDCVATAPFIDKYRDKLFQNHTLLLGGLTELPVPGDARDIDVYDVALKQFIMRDTVGTRLLNYRMCSSVRESTWNNCQVIVKRNIGAKFKDDGDFFTNNHLGLMHVSHLQTDGLVVIRDEKNFSIDGAQSIEVNDRLLVKTSSTSLEITCSENRWFIRNKASTEIKATIVTQRKIPPKGLEIQTQQPIELNNTTDKAGNYVMTVTLKGGQALVVN
jgi:hypothetical protein